MQTQNWEKKKNLTILAIFPRNFKEKVRIVRFNYLLSFHIVFVFFFDVRIASLLN